MGKVVVVGDKYTVSLFESVGTEGKAVSKPQEVIPFLTEVRKRQDIDLVLVTKDIYEAMSATIDEIMLNSARPLITVIPSPFSESEPIDSKKLIAKALGFG